MRITKTLAAALLSICCSTACAQQGAWSGDLNVMGTKLPLVFNFSADGCTLDSPAHFRRSDFVNVSITLCDATRDLINAPVFAAANPDLLLVNTSRGGIVNEHDLYIALTTGQIRAAASDVFVHEPPACDDPLIHLDNFIATFHIGGSTYESLERVSNRAVDYVFEYTGVPEQKEVIGS